MLYDAYGGISESPQRTMREIITHAATEDKQRKAFTKNHKIERYLDDMMLSRMVVVAEEGMRGYQA